MGNRSAGLEEAEIEGGRGGAEVNDEMGGQDMQVMELPMRVGRGGDERRGRSGKK